IYRRWPQKGRIRRQWPWELILPPSLSSSDTVGMHGMKSRPGFCRLPHGESTLGHHAWLRVSRSGAR
ncbi:hypothetical protein E2562_015143, partial [Oryza meyeriana var. granulata]